MEDIINRLKYLDQEFSIAISVEENYELHLNAFQRMRELTIDDPIKAEPHILNSLLPLCLQDSVEVRVLLGQLRICLEEWIYQYRGSDLFNLREQALEKVIPHLDHSLPEVRAACWTVSHIGYRTEKIYRALYRLCTNRKPPGPGPTCFR